MTVVPIARGSGHRFQVYGRRDRKPVYLGTFSSLVDAQDQERAHRAEQRDPPGITAGRLSEEFGVRIETVHRWASTGLIPFHLHGKRRRFVVDEVSSALRANGWRTGGRLSDPGSTKGQERIRRRVDQGTGSHACGRCGKTLPDECFPPSSGIRCGWWCRDCRKPAKRAADARRRSQKRSTQIEQIDIRVLAMRDGCRCGICGKSAKREDWSMDHVVPLSQGGPHTYANVVLAHVSCNSRRGAGRLPVQAPLFALP